MITVQHLTRQFRTTRALDDLSFEVHPGMVTAFLGPNGAGKSTAMRTMVGLETPTAGRVLIDGHRYREIRRPLSVVGAMLDGSAFHPARSARSHLGYLAAANGLAQRRVHEVLEQTGLETAAKRRVGRFSLGMKQRLGIAAALLGDPPVLILDEPSNGLDPEGMIWLRGLLSAFAAEGRTVLVSSHLINEVALSAERVVLIGRGRLITDAPLTDLLGHHGSLEEVYLELTHGLADFTSHHASGGTR